jgi:hypothetical protein
MSRTLVKSQKISNDTFSSEYTPTLDIPISDEIKTLCNNVVACELDAALSGLTQIGLSTGQSSSTATTARTVACKYNYFSCFIFIWPQQFMYFFKVNTSPFIINSNSTLNIDLSNPEPVSISIYAYDKDAEDVINFLWFINGVSNYTVTAQVNNTITTSINLTIVYYPSKTDVPSLQ